MISKIWTSIIGPPLATKANKHRRLSKVHALGALSPAALSSIAYANEEIYLGLITAGAAGLLLAFPISVVISLLLVIVSLSYYQTIQAYPSGGGSYIVASENLGTYPGLIAAAALVIDYVLTAAVSLTAGVAAIASAFPVLWPYRVEFSLLLLVVITLINLRGLQETGAVISVPVYLFLFTYFPMLIYGAFVLMREGITPMASVSPAPLQPLSLFLVLHAFSAGCTAMTGVEAISNSVQVFRTPESKNAGQTLIIMAVLMAALFLGSIAMTQGLGVIADGQETILSALARRLFGFGIPYLIIQGGTMLVLVVAANTSFAGFPRLAAILAEHGYFPRQFTNLGDRLVFSNGIVSLAVITALLIIVYQGDTHLLIPLFAVGVFLAFTLSQIGMVLHWYRERGHNWIIKAILNGLGALATAVTVLVLGISKFFEGAWITLIIVPLVVFILKKINSHYRDVGQELVIHNGKPPMRPEKVSRVVIPVGGIHRGMIDAVNFARGSFKEVIALYVELDPGRGLRIQQQWQDWWPDVKFVIRESPYRSVITPLLDYLDELDEERADGQLTAVILPEIIPSRWWHNLLHNQSALLIKSALLYRRRELGFQRIIIDVPYHLNK